MKEKIGEILKQLVKHGFKLRYIRGIRFSEVYDTFTSNYKSIVTIEILRLEYGSGKISNALKDLGYNIEITYHGEYSENRPMPTNMWVKLTEEERAAYKKRKDPCLGCERISMHMCSNTGLDCQYIQCYLNENIK